MRQETTDIILVWVTLIISWTASVNLTHARQLLMSVKINKYSTSVHFDVEEN